MRRRHLLLPPLIWLVAACSDASEGHIGVPLDAATDAGPEPTGALSVSPLALEFGKLCPGATAQRSVEIANTGAGATEVVSISVRDDADGDFGLEIGASLPLDLAPGARHSIDVRYAPTTAGADTATLRVAAYDGEAEVALAGHGGGPAIAANPTGLAFGAVAVGNRVEATLDLANLGTGSLSIQAPELVPAAPLTSASLWVDQGLHPFWPEVIEASEALRLVVVFRPLAYAPPSDSPIGTLTVRSNACEAPALTIPIEGWPGGTDRACGPDPTITEDFVGKPALDTDVLFVVDDSESMLDEQQKLADNFNAFISSANALAIDYRIGVTTTDMETVGGALQGETRVVTPANWEAFLTNVKVGVGGSTSEKGLAAAAASLTDPAHFGSVLRPGAVLALVFVSDEADKSPDPVSSYRNLFAGLKDDPKRFLAHAIVGPEAGCETANPGPRYIELAATSGGTFASICEASFAATLLELGGTAFGWKTLFDLAEVAVPGTVTVTVGGAPCTEGWRLEPSGTRIRFDPSSPCLPDEGDAVTIRYEMVCL